MAESSISVLLVEDDAMVRGWVRLSLQGTEFHVAGEAGSAGEALDLVERRRPGLLLCDYRLPDGVGTEFVRELRRLGHTMPAILMTANHERGLNETARDAGAQGSLLKTGSLEELLETLRAVAAGEEAFDGRHPKRPDSQVALTPRQREVLRLIAAGATNKAIAEHLEISDETVKTLLTRTFAKLGVHRRAEAVSVANKLDLI